MRKEDKKYIVDLLEDILSRFDYYSYLDNQEKHVFDILEEAVEKIKEIKKMRTNLTK